MTWPGAMQSDIRWMVLFKFGKRERLEQLRKDGVVYMRRSSDFAELEAHDVRADRFEGTSRIITQTSIKEFKISGPAALLDNKIQYTSISIPPSDMAGPLSVALDKDACNIFSMFALTTPTNPPLADQRVAEFGDSLVIVLNTLAFLDRICSAAKTAGYICQYGLVEYYNGAYSGQTGPFRKRADLSWQNGFRFIIRPAQSEPLSLFAGSTCDITSEVLPISDIDSLCDFGPESARRAGLL
jgi:hypothetical protein